MSCLQHYTIITGQLMESQQQKHHQNRYVILEQLEHMDALVSSMAPNDFCHHTSFVRILQFPNRHFPIFAFVHTLESWSSWTLESYVEKCQMDHFSLHYSCPQTLANQDWKALWSMWNYACRSIPNGKIFTWNQYWLLTQFDNRHWKSNSIFTVF